MQGTILDTCAGDNGLWIIFNNFPALIYYDFDIRKVTFLRDYPDDEYVIRGGNFYSESICWADNKLFILPADMDYVVVYDSISDTFFKKEIEVTGKSLRKCRKGFSYNGEMYCFPHLYKRIIKINLNTLDVSYTGDLENICGNDGIYMSDRIGDTVVSGLIVSNALLTFDLKSETWNLVDIKADEKAGFVLYCCDSHDGLAYELCNSTKERIRCVNIYDGSVEGMLHTDFKIQNIFEIYDGRVLVTDRSSNQYLICDSRLNVLDKKIIDRNQKTLRLFDLSSCEKVKGKNGKMFFINQDYIYCLNDDLTFEAQKLEGCEKRRMEFMDAINSFGTETFTHSLSDFIGYISEG